MRSSRSTCRSLLALILLISSLVSGCQGSQPATSAAEMITATLESTSTPHPTRTRVTLPATLTRTPTVKAVLPSRTPSPTATATLNSPQTMAAKKTADAAVKCSKYQDAWQIQLSPSSWKSGWCEIESKGGTYYEYQLVFPSEWKVTTFGDVYPNLAFNTGQDGVEVRLYQLYNYTVRKFEGTLADSPLKAAFCDNDDQCTRVIPAREEITLKETRQVGGRAFLVVDSTDGKRSTRWYFFFVPFKYTRPASNRLFFFKLNTPDAASSANYVDVENQIIDIIPSIKQDLPY